MKKVKALLYDYDKVLGLGLAGFTANSKLELPADIQQLVDEREVARTNQEWSRADQLRHQLEAAGYHVQDTVDGQQVTTRQG